MKLFARFFGPANQVVSNEFSDRLATFLPKKKKTRENEGRTMVSNDFSALQTMSTLKCHGNFRPEIDLINLRLLDSNVSLPFGL